MVDLKSLINKLKKLSLHGPGMEHFASIIKNRVSGCIIENKRLEKLPDAKSEKPVVVLNIDHLMGSYKFSLRRFDVHFVKQKYSEEFLFHLGNNFEIIGVSGVYFPLSKSTFEKVDPYGCISYKINTNKLKEVDREVINRPLNKVIVIGESRNDYHESLHDNVVEVSRSSFYDASANNNGRNGPFVMVNSHLFDILHFCNNLFYSNAADYRTTIQSYRGKNFCSSFHNVQMRLFRQRNLFSFFGRKFDEKLSEVNSNKIRIYREAKMEMDEIKGEKKKDWWVTGVVVGGGWEIAKNLILWAI